jgi:hypothetical protein
MATSDKCDRTCRLEDTLAHFQYNFYNQDYTLPCRRRVQHD